MPAVALDYDAVLAAVEETRRQALSGSRDERVLNEVAVHLREDILGEPKEVKELVRELWRTHGRALRIALRHRPRLRDVRDPYVKLLRERYGDDAHFSYWPARRGDLRVIKMRFSSWTEKGFPFTFMLYTDGEGRSHVRVLIRRERYEERADSLASWAHRVNTSAGFLIDEDFRLDDYWRAWRGVLRQESYPSSAALEEDAFDEDTVRAAADAVSTLVDLLRPHVDDK